MDDKRERRSSRDRDVSWAEIDKKRDQSSHTRSDEPRGRKRPQGVTGLSRYKTDLSRLFSRGAASGRLKAVARQAGLAVGGDQPERQKALRAILDAAGTAPIGRAIDGFEAEFGELPDDPEILTQALDHPDEAKATAALIRLRDFLAGHLPPRRTLMLQRVKALEARSESDEVRAIVDDVRKRLGG